MVDYPQKATNWILDLIFPKRCLGCGKFTYRNDFYYICGRCFKEIGLKNVFECIGCKRQTQYGFTCLSCKKDNPVDQLLAALDLSDPLIDEVLKAYKYKFISDLSRPLSVIAKKFIKKLLSKRVNIFQDNPLVIPVPLHKRRLNWRGFNQSQLLAKSIAGSFLASYAGNALIRISHSKNQADTKTREDRFKNIKGQFAVSNKEIIKNRTIILVDDICTSGATLNECARVLKNPPAGGGSSKVIALVIARG